MSVRFKNLLLRTQKNLACSCGLLHQSGILQIRSFSKDPKKTEDISLIKKDYNIYNRQPITIQDSEDEAEILPSIGKKYKAFRDEDAPVIFDVVEEIQNLNLQDSENSIEYRDPYEGINMTRGTTGVFEIEDLVELLKKDNAKNIFVASVPKEYSYVDYIVIVTAKSSRHMTALTHFVRKAYKLKRNEKDILPKVEGKHSKEWQALDLGNIALHIFSHEAREMYDLETLWSVGSKYDDLSNKKDNQLNDVIKQFSEYFKDFQPANS